MKLPDEPLADINNMKGKPSMVSKETSPVSKFAMSVLDVFA